MDKTTFLINMTSVIISTILIIVAYFYASRKNFLTNGKHLKIMKYFLVIMALITALYTIYYWLSIFTGAIAIEDVAPGATEWFMSFPIADTWLAVCFALSAIFLLCGSDKAIPFGIAAGTSTIFMALNGFMHGIYTGTICILTTGQIYEIALKTSSLIIGSFFIIIFWKIRNSALFRS